VITRDPFRYVALNGYLPPSERVLKVACHLAADLGVGYCDNSLSTVRAARQLIPVTKMSACVKLTTLEP